MKKVIYKNLTITIDEDMKKLGKKIDKLEKDMDNYDIEEKRRKRLANWIYGEGMCEFCGERKATVNLDLKGGTHRECRRCWDYW